MLVAAAALTATACSSSRKIPPLPRLEAERARLLWSVDLDGAGYGFVPALMGDQIYAAGRRGALARIDPGTGKLAWRIDTKVRLLAGVAAARSLLAVADARGGLRVYADTGALRWQADLGAEADSVPALDGDVLVVRGSDNRVLAFDAYTGARRWAYTRQNPSLVLHQTTQALIDGVTVYVGLPGGRLAALSTQTGALRWEAAISLPRGSNEIERVADVLARPVLSGRSLCAGSYQGRVGCVDAATGRMQWTSDVEATGGIDFDGRNLVAVDTSGRIHAFDSLGASRWVQKAFAGRRLGAPTLVADALVIGDEQGYLHWLALEDGALVGRVRVDDSAIVSAPVRHGGLAIVQSSRGRVAAVRLG